MIQIRNKKIAVIGAARSGLAAARLLHGHGADVRVSDRSSIRPEGRALLDAEGIRWEEGGHSDLSRQVDLAVVSPGVPDEAPVMEFYRTAGIPVFSELEVASWYNKGPIIAVTGSNGKTTVSSWLAWTWRTAGRPFLLAGNIGTAFSEVVEETRPGQTSILEVSSFQLDHIRHFRPDVSILLNITPDHLDRYGNRFENYVASKLSIIRNQQADDALLYNLDDPVLAERMEELARQEIHPRLYAFSVEREVERGAFFRDGKLIIKLNEEETIMHQDQIGLPGRHNLYNSLVTALAARVSEIENEAIRESLQRFEGIEHRLEFVREYKGIRYINDSKATNINSVWFALDSYKVPIVLILGGRDKGNDWLALKSQIMEKVHTIIAIGEARPAIRKELGELVPWFHEADTLQDAVRIAAGKAKRGEIVLLSPACASFDMFDSYEHRGEMFKKAVHELA